MVNGLFFCVTLTNRREGHIPFLQTGAEAPVTDAEAGRVIPGWVGASVGDENAESCRVVRHSAFHW